jgi:2'-hydroxyisoflavone reductase
MRLLILGGGVFLGSAVLTQAIANGHDVTVFNRGRSRTVWPSEVRVITGDRAVSMAPLERLSSPGGAVWDAVIDTCGYVPADVQRSVNALRECGRYLFVSSVSAYASFSHAPVQEGDALASAEGVTVSDRGPEHYGAQKAACENVLTRAFGERALIVRPGLIVGPGDPTGRFSHWPWRVAAGGDVLVPDVENHHPLQFIDVRDLAAWMLNLLERSASGPFNLTGPTGGRHHGWQSVLAACVDEARQRGCPESVVVPVSEAFLAGQGVLPWSELPLWIPSDDPSHAAFMRVSLARAEGCGLQSRPIADTVAAIMSEPRPLPGDERVRLRLSRSREAELIAQWRIVRQRTGDRPGAFRG